MVWGSIQTMWVSCLWWPFTLYSYFLSYVLVTMKIMACPYWSWETIHVIYPGPGCLHDKKEQMYWQWLGKIQDYFSKKHSAILYRCVCKKSNTFWLWGKVIYFLLIHIWILKIIFIDRFCLLKWLLTVKILYIFRMILVLNLFHVWWCRYCVVLQHFYHTAWFVSIMWYFAYTCMHIIFSLNI